MRLFSPNPVFFCTAILCLFTLACRPKTRRECATEYNLAQSHFSSFYRTRDSSELELALNTVNDAPPCDEYRKRFMALKISILFLQKRYEDEIRYIDSCKAEDFDKPYQKKFSENYVRAKLSEEQHNPENRTGLLKDNLALLGDYIRKSKQAAIDSSAYFDFFLMESMLLPKEKFFDVLDSARHSRPADSLFFRAIGASFYAAAADSTGSRHSGDTR